MWPLHRDYKAVVTPSVPPESIRYVVAYDDYEEFIFSGFEVGTMLNLACKKTTGMFLTEMGTVLDFGCGCGRIARFVPPRVKLYGCDVNGPVIDYCQRNLTQHSFYRNPLYPPLKYADNFFDVVYSFSIFSHLTKEVEELWLEELLRVGKPGCYYFITVHGDWVIEATMSPEEKATVDRDGFFFKKVHGREGNEYDMPDYYEASYHNGDYIKREWSRYLDIIDIVGGRSTEWYTEGMDRVGDTPCPRLRPMGQDLVVARKR